MGKSKHAHIIVYWILYVYLKQGAGHMVPSDRPGPAVQMITNFMFPDRNGPDYSSTANVNPNPPVSCIFALPFLYPMATNYVNKFHFKKKSALLFPQK